MGFFSFLFCHKIGTNDRLVSTIVIAADLHSLICDVLTVMMKKIQLPSAILDKLEIWKSLVLFLLLSSLSLKSSSSVASFLFFYCFIFFLRLLLFQERLSFQSSINEGFTLLRQIIFDTTRSIIRSVSKKEDFDLLENREKVFEMIGCMHSTELGEKEKAKEEEKERKKTKQITGVGLAH